MADGGIELTRFFIATVNEKPLQWTLSTQNLPTFIPIPAERIKEHVALVMD